jgi:carbon storage regulator
MLVIKRREGESVIVRIGDKEVKIVVIEIGNQVKLGFQAPPEIAIHREEVAERFKS